MYSSAVGFKTIGQVSQSKKLAERILSEDCNVASDFA